MRIAIILVYIFKFYNTCSLVFIMPLVGKFQVIMIWELVKAIPSEI